MFRLGYLQLKRGDYTAASAAFKTCIEKRKNWREAELNLAMALWKLNEHDAAREVLVPVNRPRARLY